MISVKAADLEWTMEVMKRVERAHFDDRSLKAEQRAADWPHGDLVVPKKMRKLG